LASSDPDQVAARLRIALDLACDQGAVAFQLRIASDLFTRTGDTAARGELVASLSRFAPGASYPELDAARSSLAP
jgi:hypothetical protein